VLSTAIPADRLARLAAEVARDLERLGLPPANWPASRRGPDGGAALEVLVIGAGMFGIGAAIGLIFKGIRNILLVDRSPRGLEGPWLTYARMETLRSPKHLPGPACGVPSLTFRAWYEARYGAAAWQPLYKVLNGDWQDYLGWLRDVLGLPVRNQVDVLRLSPGGSTVAARCASGEVLHARRVVLATGRFGTGGVFIPEGVERGLWPDRAAHTMEEIDFAALRGRSVAVLGAGAAAWDNAAVALEAGAARVEMYARRKVLPQVNKGRGSATPGYFEGWPALEPAHKWALLTYLHDRQAPPPHETIHRTIRHPGFALHLDSRVKAARRLPDGVALDLPERTDRVDFLIVGTGFLVDLALEPVLAEVVPHLALWGERYQPPPDLVRPELARFPWLGDGFELTEKAAGCCPALGRLHLFNHAALASLGPIASDVPGVSIGVERLAARIAQHIFREDYAEMRAALEAFAEPELESTPYFVPPV
jgi:cation diffusion facilitator CzcD-associated flavoprotein CzcO